MILVFTQNTCHSCHIF